MITLQPVENRGRHYGVAEHGTPLADDAVAGDQYAAALVAARHELEEEMRHVPLEWQVVRLVDDQQVRLDE